MVGRGDTYKAKIGGLVTFEKMSGDGWISVATDGIISGIPDRVRDAIVTIRATISPTGQSGTLKISIPVKRSGSSIVQELKVMAFILWWGGTYIDNYHAKQIRFIVSQRRYHRLAGSTRRSCTTSRRRPRMVLLATEERGPRYNLQIPTVPTISVSIK